MDRHLREPQRERPPRRLRARAGGRRGRSRARASGSPRSSARDAADDDLHQATPPRRSTSSPTPGARDNVGPGDAVLITQMEHHANIVPWQLLCRRRGAKLRYLEVDERGELSLDAARRGARARRRASWSPSRTSRTCSARSTRSPRSPRARAPRARVTLVDGAQAVPQMPVDVAAIGADFYAWTGHKALGPTGIGVLHGRRELLEAMRAVPGRRRHDRLGRAASASTWNELPCKFEAGTPPIAEAVGLGAAVDYLDALGMERVRAHERELTALRCSSGSPRCRGVRVVGPPDAERPRRRGRRSRSRACTRTTSPSCSTARASASAPATTARSR